MKHLIELDKYKWETIRGFQVNFEFTDNALIIIISDGDEVILDLAFKLLSGPIEGSFTLFSHTANGDLIARVSEKKIVILDPERPYEKIDIFPMDSDD